MPHRTILHGHISTLSVSERYGYHSLTEGKCRVTTGAVPLQTNHFLPVQLNPGDLFIESDQRAVVGVTHSLIPE
jgi:hypothetical protein